MKSVLLFLCTTLSFASDPVQIGLYSGAIEVHDRLAFELLKGGKAIVTSDYYDLDGSRKKAPSKVIKGMWSYRDPFLTISYGTFKDKFRREDCPQPYPCYKFEESHSKNISPLNVPYGFGLRPAK